jgi:aryl-alcohol dehydrogenase-like predicted oxidoreductase
MNEITNVNRIGYGAMQLPGPGVWGPPTDRAAALAVLRHAVELGVDHIDTAQFYGPDVANDLIREALHPYPEDLLIATKVGARRGEDRSWLPAPRPEELRDQVHANLRSLGLERLGLVNLRLGDGEGMAESGVPLAESLGALVDLQSEGLIDEIGLSNVNVEQLEAARALTGIAAVQNLYNLADRRSADVLAATAEAGIAFVPFFPLGAAWATDDVLGRRDVQALAARHDATTAQVALAWLLAAGPHVRLIPGTTSVAHLEENLAAGDVELTPEDVAELG